MSAILAEIESVAREIDLHITDLKPQKVRKGEFLNNFSVSLSANGRLEEITHFLYILQSSPHLFNIEELAIEKSSAQTQILQTRISLSRILIP